MTPQPRDERTSPAEDACQEYGIDIPLLPHDVTAEWIADFIWSHNGSWITADDEASRNAAEIMVDTDAALIYRHVMRARTRKGAS